MCMVNSNTQLSSNSSKRIDYLDIAKGILIITVVMCHSPASFGYYFYWFHMPAFFIISGILFKKNINIKDQARKFFIPYVAYTFVDIIMEFISAPSEISIHNFCTYFLEHIYSGKAVPGVFWFIPCLFLTKIIFCYMKKYLNNKTIALLCAILYVGVHIYSRNFIAEEIVNITKGSWVIWNLDVLPMSLTYYFIGYISKDMLEFLKSKYTLILSAVACIVYFYCNKYFGIYYYLNMKYSYYKFYIFDLVVPILFTILILAVSYQISKHKDNIIEKVFSMLGSRSLVVMYLHRPLNLVFAGLIQGNYLIYTLLGILIPLIFTKIIEKYPVCKYLFEGIRLKNKERGYSY